MRRPGSARLGSMLRVRRASVACEKSPRVAHECVRALSRIHICMYIHWRRARSAGRFHAWTMAAVTLKRALPLSYASACGQPRVQTCATPPQHFPSSHFHTAKYSSFRRVQSKELYFSISGNAIIFRREAFFHLQFLIFHFLRFHQE